MLKFLIFVLNLCFGVMTVLVLFLANFSLSVRACPGNVGIRKSYDSFMTLATIVALHLLHHGLHDKNRIGFF